MKIRIHLNDEAPRIGSGWRNVEVLTLGYKWVTVRAYGARKKFKRKVWDEIVKGSA